MYVTTNYDEFMITALRERNKKPVQIMCAWNEEMRGYRSSFEKEPEHVPSVERPAVFHFHGCFRQPESMVLTEDDYVDFLIEISKNEKLLPPVIRASFTGASLLFIGYSIADWNFRVIFRSLVEYMRKSLKRAHIAVQLPPLALEMSMQSPGDGVEDRKERVQKIFIRLFQFTRNPRLLGDCT